MKKVLIWSVVVIALFAFGACGGGGGGDGKTAKQFGASHGSAGVDGSDLVLLSPDDGSFINTIGSIGFWVTGLEYDTVSNKLYGTTDNWELIEIDMATGVASTIGPGAGTQITRPTVDSTGQMVVWSPWDSGDDGLAIVDTATGDVTVTLWVDFSPDEHGLAFDNEDNLYLINWNGDIYTIGHFGLVTYVGTIGTMAHHGDFHPVTGLYWGIDRKHNASGPHLLAVDVNTPAVLDSLATVEKLHAITFYYD